jgi:hypothetical protein
VLHYFKAAPLFFCNFNKLIVVGISVKGQEFNEEQNTGEIA